MHISWLGNYSIRIQTEDKVIIIDPHPADGKLSAFRGKADIVALSHPSQPEMSHVSGAQGAPLVFGSPGEYSADSLSMTALGWHAEDNSERNIQRWEIERLTMLHIGALENRDLTTEELQHIETTTIDVLFLPIGGGSGLSTKTALKLLGTIQPRIVIPINYDTGNTTEKLESVETFANEMGISATEKEKKLIVKANKLPEDELETVILST